MTRTVVLWSTRDSRGSRHLSASFTPSGDLEIRGQDLGADVEAIFGQGITEYEYAVLVQAKDLPALLGALGATADALSALQERFTSQPGVEPVTFLNEHDIAYKFWSRLGE